jgi:hypothetical protein
MAIRCLAAERLVLRPAWWFRFWIAIATAAVTVSFVLALTAIPNDVPYPFTSAEIARQWPGDYLWMYPAMVLMLLFVALLAVIHEQAPQTRKPASLFSLCVGVVAAAVILIDYFIQVTVMQPSLEKRQYDGWALFTQYNPNGIFIALEELGYLLMTVSLVGLAPVFSAETRLSRAIRWLFVTSFSAAVTHSLLYLSRAVPTAGTHSRSLSLPSSG